MLVIDLGLFWDFFAVCSSSLVATSKGYSLSMVLQGTQASVVWLVGSGVQAQQWQWMGLIALRHVESLQTRDRSHSPALAGRFVTTGPPGKST